MSSFCLLREPEAYVADSWNLLTDPAGKDYWLDLFANHFKDATNHALDHYGRRSGKRVAAAREAFAATIESLRSGAAVVDGMLTVIDLCRMREKVLRDNDLPDPFGHIKDRENSASLDLYKDVVRELNSLSGDELWLRIVRGVFAGNIFDLGSPSTMHLASESPDFLAVLDDVKPRPWAVDDFDRLVQDLPHSPPPKWSKAVVFIDNAGSDFILGVMPMVRELALAGTQIVLAANELPTLNDLTVVETLDIIDELAVIDDALSALLTGDMISVVSSGNDVPLIDLSEVTDELNEAAKDADLIILEGMGRAIESNYDTEFKVDCLRLALLKDPNIAARVKAGIYDPVCKYTPVEA